MVSECKMVAGRGEIELAGGMLRLVGGRELTPFDRSIASFVFSEKLIFAHKPAK